MRITLNNRAKAAFGVDNDPFKSIRFVSSDQSRLIQAVDVVTGAIAFEKNGNHNAKDASPTKVALWHHVKTILKLDTLAHPTKGWRSQWFGIREFDFKKAKLPKTKPRRVQLHKAPCSLGRQPWSKSSQSSTD
jgi:hypothetical protein